jgi:antitoxin (DNA-binding transcriptional repressor) of toxin-antitoxin stability system
LKYSRHTPTGAGRASRQRAGVADEQKNSYVSDMEKANISQLKNRLDAYLRKVRAGETVLVMDRGVPVARIERIAIESNDDRLARLEAAGLVKRPAKPVPMKRVLRPLPRKRKSSGVLQALLKERSEGR